MSNLIDREALLKKLEEYMVSAKDVILATPEEIHNYNGGLRTAIQIVADAPTVEPEQKNGRMSHE